MKHNYLIKYMRKITVFTFLLVFGQMAMSQQKLAPVPQLNSANMEKALRAEGLSATSAFLLADLTFGKLNEQQLVEKYSLVYVDGQATVTAFVEGGEKTLEGYGAKVVSQSGKIMRVNIPLSQFVALAQSGVCSRIDVGAKGKPALEAARAELGINNIYNGVGLSQAYDGTGVVVGIIDIGFEYCHPAFYDSTGTVHRVKRAWSQMDTTGNPPAGFGYGTEHTTTEEMMAAQCSHTTESHGSHVAGIAAGCGGNTDATRQFRGMAPAADIVMVATTMQDPTIFDGITYIVNYAQSVGKPCVINMSIGGQVGPHDGTSSFDRACDGVIAAHPQGVVLVGAAGNEGCDKLHLQKQFTAQDTALCSFVESNDGVEGSAIFDMWGAPNMSYKVALAVVNTATGEYVATSGYYSTDSSFVVMDSIPAERIGWWISSSESPVTNRQEMIVSVDYDPFADSAYRLAVLVVSDSTTLHVWGYNCQFSDAGVQGALEGDNNITVGEIGGTGNHIVSVGAYTTRTHWFDINGEDRTRPGDSIIEGYLTYFSSLGPTADGRTKPDITAPGQFILAPINSYDEGYRTEDDDMFCVASTEFNGSTHYYGEMRGTSMACPMVTGIVALWLQAHPDYGFDSVIALIRSTARTDSITGIIPAAGSNRWGWGKINPFGALPAAQPQSIETTDGIDFTVAVDGRRILVAAPQGEPVRIVDVMGRTIVDQTLNTQYSTLNTFLMPSAGVYVIRLGNGTARKVIVN